MDTIKKAVNDNYDLLLTYDKEVRHILAIFEKLRRAVDRRNGVTNGEHPGRLVLPQLRYKR